MTTLNLQVGTNTDDAEEKQDGGAFSASVAYNRVQAFTGANNRYSSGFRFTSVTVGNGDTINTATFQVYVAFADDVNGNFHVEDVDDSADFTATADVIDRALTAASVLWDAANLENNSWHSCPEIKTAFQEVVNRGGWASGQGMMVIGVGNDDAYRNLGVVSHDNDNSLAAKLAVTFTAGGTDRRATVSQTELEVPTTPRKIQMSWVEIETPIAARRAQVSWNELELPTGSRRGQVTQAEIELPFAPRRSRLSWAEIETPVLNRRGRVSQGAIEVPTAPRQIQLSQVELEAPDATRKGLISWAEFEIPTSPRQGRVSWVEIEAPLAPRQGQVSWVEFEVPNIPISPRGAQVSWVELEVSNIELLPDTFRPPPRDRQVFIWFITGILDPLDYEFASALTTGDLALTQKGQLWVYNGVTWKRIATT